MADFDLPVVKHSLVGSLDSVIQAATEVGYPLVMKTAEPDIAHKSDCGGVIVNIQDQQGLEQAYADLLSRLGSKVIIMPMISGGIEVSLGMKNDPHYGPMLIIAAGGIFIELLNDRAFALAPVDAGQAVSLLSHLKLSRLLDGIRGQPAVDRAALVSLIVNFSELVYAFGESIAEVDLNPVIVSRQGCTIVDALIISKTLDAKITQKN